MSDTRDSKRVLLSGSTGFVGRQCLRTLLASGYDVHATTISDPNDAYAEIDFEVDVSTPRLTWHRLDFRDTDAVRTLIETLRPESLMHLAWFTKHIEAYTSHENVRWFEDSIKLFDYFVQCGGQRVVVSGSCAEYDWSTGTCNEDATPMVPKTLYGICKHATHQYLAALAAQSGLSYAWARLFYVYGPHDYNPRIIPSVIRSILAGRQAKCSAGTQMADFLHVYDVASALTTLLGSDVRGPVNIASGKAVAVRDVAIRLSKFMGRPDLLELGVLPLRENDPPKIEGTVHRLRDEVRWNPSMTLDDGLKHTIDWWKSKVSSEGQ